MSTSENEIMKQPILNSQSNELFDEDSHVIHKLINIKRISLPQKGEDWQVLENNKVAFTLKGIKMTQKEKNVLYTLEGIQLLIKEYKLGNKTVSGIKKKIKELIKRK